MTRMKIAIGLVALASLSACGLKGEMERPEPLWGDPPIEGPNDPRVLNKEAEQEAKEKEAIQVPDDELLGGPEG